MQLLREEGKDMEELFEAIYLCEMTVENQHGCAIPLTVWLDPTTGGVFAVERQRCSHNQVVSPYSDKSLCLII